MDNIINTFYIGNTNRFGFGTYNASSNNYKGILSNYNYPSNQNRSINTYFQKQNNNIRLPPISAKNPRIDFSNINSAEQLKPLSQKQFQNFDNYAFQNSYTKNVPNNQNFTPALIRMQYLEDKINNLEYKNKENIQNNINDIEEKYIGKDSRFKQFLDNHQNEVNNMYTNKLLNRLNEGNLYDFQYNPMLVRRKEVQNQLNILRNDLNNEEKYEKKKKKKKKHKNYDDEDYDEFDDDDIDITKELYNEPKFKKRSSLSTISKSTTKSKNKNIFNNNRNSSNLSNPFVNNNSPSTINNNNNFTNSITNDNNFNNNFNNISVPNTRRKSIQFKNGPLMQAIGNNYYARGRNKINDELFDEAEKTNKHFSDLVNILNGIKNDLNSKLNAYEVNQRNLYDNYKQILSIGGNPKMNKAVRRILNREKIPIDENDEMNNYYKSEVDKLLEKKLLEYNTFRDEDDLKRKIQQQKQNELLNIERKKEEEKKTEVSENQSKQSKITDKQFDIFYRGNGNVVYRDDSLVFKKNRIDLTSNKSITKNNMDYIDDEQVENNKFKVNEVKVELSDKSDTIPDALSMHDNVENLNEESDQSDNNSNNINSNNNYKINTNNNYINSINNNNNNSINNNNNNNNNNTNNNNINNNSINNNNNNNNNISNNQTNINRQNDNNVTHNNYDNNNNNENTNNNQSNNINNNNSNNNNNNETDESDEEYEPF